METKRPMTAQEYRALAREKEAEDKSRPTEIVTMKNGSVWELRRPDLSRYVFSGRLPNSLLLAGRSAWNKKDPKSELTDHLLSRMSDRDILTSAQFLRDLISDCTVNPHIAWPVEDDNDIDPKDVLREDQQEILEYIGKHLGVAGIDGLQSFRDERGSTVGDQPYGAAVQPETVEPPPS